MGELKDDGGCTPRQIRRLVRICLALDLMHSSLKTALRLRGEAMLLHRCIEKTRYVRQKHFNYGQNPSNEQTRTHLPDATPRLV